RDGPQPRLEVPADAVHLREQPAIGELVEETERRAAGEQVAAIGTAVIAERDLRGDLLADQRRADRHAGAERLAEGDKLRLQPEYLEVERLAGAAETRLHLVGNQQRTGSCTGIGDCRGERGRERPDA